jgi:hypothetical protein
MRLHRPRFKELVLFLKDCGPKASLIPKLSNDYSNISPSPAAAASHKVGVTGAGNTDRVGLELADQYITLAP